MNLKLPFFAIFVLFYIFLVALFPFNGFSQSFASSKTNSYIMQLRKLDSIPGIAVAVLKKGKVAYKQYTGYANLELAVPVNDSSVFQIASVSKQFTAAGIMLLVEQGRIRLNDHVSNYLANTPSDWSEITIRNLLAHNSGLMNYEDIPGFAEKAYLDSTHTVVLKSILQSLYRQKLRFSPGERSEYCNSNYFVLGAVIEKITGESFERFLINDILQPLHMVHTQVNEMYHIIHHRVSGYTSLNHELINADRLGMDWFFAEGNIVMTLDDLIKWVQMSDGEKLLRKATIDSMTLAGPLTDGLPGKFGFGWFIDTGNSCILYHSGHTPGFSAFVYKNRLKNTAILMLMNNDNITTPRLLKMAKDIDSYY